jgi:outer membrane protein insertion porin family
MSSCLILLGAILSGQIYADVTMVRRVEVIGNFRVPAESILRQVSAASERPFDPAASQADLRKLYGMGVFQNVEIDSRDAGKGWVDVTYRVKEFPFVSAFLLDGVKEGLEAQIHDFLRKEKLEIRPATPFNPSATNKTALAVRDFLRERKHPNADVRVLPESTGSTVRVVLQIRPGPRMEVGAVRFSGNKSVSDDELRRQMKHTRAAPFYARLAGAGRYVPEELLSDLEQIRRFYQSRGFATAAVGKPSIEAQELHNGIHLPLPGLSGMNPKVVVEIPIIEGPQFTLSSVQVEGDAKAAAAKVGDLIRAVRVPSLYDASLLENTRQKIIGALGHHGYALARVDLEQSVDAEQHSVRAFLRISAGDPVLIGKIDFEGNKRLPDKFLRRELRAGEGEVFDSAKLDQSIERLNKCNLVQEVHRSDVALRMDEERDALDITIKVKEKDRQGIYGTGGTGGIGGGYLGLIYTAFNLLRLGETLSLELDGGASQSNILLDIVGTHFLGTPFTVALAGFNRLTNFNVASIVPGPENLVQVLRRRTRGAGLSGAYPITTKLQMGLGFQVARDSVTGEAQPGSAFPDQTSNRSELAPFVVYDSTRGIGPATCGYRIGFSHAFSGAGFLQSLDSTRDSFQFSRYFSDPWSGGRNSFAFMFQASAVRPRGSSPLFIDRRLFPGDESVRGFQRGGLSPWAYVPDNTASPLQPAGADMLLGFSSEYRVPIRGALSGVAFMDLGWTHVSPFEAAQMSKEARLVEETNGLLRASMGGELRLQLSMIHQPARVIFAWNPLRLSGLLRNSPSLLRLSDPRGSVRFALGNIY